VSQSASRESADFDPGRPESADFDPKRPESADRRFGWQESAESDERSQTALAAAMNTLAIQLRAAGRTADALAAAQEAVALLRDLADTPARSSPQTAPDGGGANGAGPRSEPGDQPVFGERPAPSQSGARSPASGQAMVREHSVARCVAAGFSRVPIVRLARLGRRSHHWPGLAQATLAALPAAVWPLVLELVLYVFARRYALVTADAISWVIALVIVNLGALVGARRSWSILDEASASVDDLLVRSSGRDRLTRWLWRVLGRWRQILFSLLVAAAAAVLLGYARPAIEGQLELGLVSFVSVAWTGFIAGDATYCVVVMSRFGRRLLRLRDLSLVWHSPASTPGIAQLSSGYTYGTSAILVIAIAVEVLALKVSMYGDSVVLNTISITFPVAAALAALIFGVLPHWWLYRVVRDARREVLRRLSPPAALPSTAAQVADAQAKISLYRLVESSPGLPFSTASMVQYSAAVISTLIGTVLAILLGRA
jgi:hypothetical protein